MFATWLWRSVGFGVATFAVAYVFGAPAFLQQIPVEYVAAINAVTAYAIGSWPRC